MAWRTYWGEKASAPSLEDLSHRTVISNLGKLAGSVECNFSCGGVLSQLSSIVLDYKKPSGEWSSEPVQLPVGSANEESMQIFLASCSTASFGIGSEMVIDKSYRNALKLEPGNFHTSFELANTTILREVIRIMSVSSSIRAELYKLNVYSTSGHFKSHVDTPRSDTMFGSLVVCLPSHFKGGELVTQHQGRQVTFDWSTAPATYWAAFFSNVEHEILPVTSGYRFTLTYNLYHTSAIEQPLLDVTSNPFYQALWAALQNPHFMRGGGILGFYCQHKYIDITTDIDKFSPHLKGEDAVVYEVVKSLGLPIALRPILSDVTWTGPPVPFKYRDGEPKKLSRAGPGNFTLPDFRHYNQDCNLSYGENDECEYDFLTQTCSGLEKIHGISWCQNPALFEPIMSALAYGNEPSLQTYYQSAAFLVTVPKFTSRRGCNNETTVTPDPADCPPAKVIKTTL